MLWNFIMLFTDRFCKINQNHSKLCKAQSTFMILIMDSSPGEWMYVLITGYAKYMRTQSRSKIYAIIHNSSKTKVWLTLNFVLLIWFFSIKTDLHYEKVFPSEFRSILGIHFRRRRVYNNSGLEELKEKEE